MKKSMYSSYGPPAEVLKIQDVEIPTPKSGEVVVKMIQASIIPADIYTMMGFYGNIQKLPATPGYEGIGIIHERSADCCIFQNGDFVVIEPGQENGFSNGCFQEYVCLREDQLLRIPKQFEPKQVTQLFVTLLCSWVILQEEFGIKQGQSLLVTAAGSTLGRVTAQFAKILGIKAIGVVRNPKSESELINLGYEKIIVSDGADLSKQILKATSMKGVDMVLEAVGGVVTGQCFECLTPNGKLLYFGSMSNSKEMSLNARKMLFNGLTVKGFWITNWWRRTNYEKRIKMVTEVLEISKKNNITAPIEAEYPFEQLLEAMEHSQRSGNRGRVLINF